MGGGGSHVVGAGLQRQAGKDILEQRSSEGGGSGGWGCHVAFEAGGGCECCGGGGGSDVSDSNDVRF